MSCIHVSKKKDFPLRNLWTVLQVGLGCFHKQTLGLSLNLSNKGGFNIVEAMAEVCLAQSQFQQQQQLCVQVCCV